MEILDLKTIYPNSFIDYIGRRVAKITLHGKKPKNRLNQRLKIEEVSISEYIFDPVNNRTIITVNSGGRPFLPVEGENIPPTPTIKKPPKSASNNNQDVNDFIMLPEMGEEHNWKEDYPHENGCYKNNCGGCGKDFFGHKNRIRCKPCMKVYMSSDNIELPQ